MKVTNRDLREIADQLVEQGWTISYTRSGHLRWLSPVTGQSVFSGSTPSCWRGILNLKTKLRREGAKL